jgi:hypothetical protein
MPRPDKTAIPSKYQLLIKFNLFLMSLIIATSVPEKEQTTEDSRLRLTASAPQGGQYTKSQIPILSDQNSLGF